MYFSKYARGMVLLKLLVVNNLQAGVEDGALFDYLRFISKDAQEICLRNTDGSCDLRELLQGAERFDAVVASGGDGTIATISHALADTKIPILPFPAGTANLLAENLNSPIEPFALAQITKNMKTLDFDLGEIVVQGKRFGFGIMAGAGYDATIMHGAKRSKQLLGALAYFQAAVQNPLPKRSHISLDIDGTHIEREALGVLLVNFSKIQFDITLVHENLPRDGSLDVIILKAENAFGLIPALIAGILDRDGEFPSRSDGLEILRGRNVTVHAEPPLQIQYDGEVPGLTTPFSAHVRDKAVRYILSQRGWEQFSEKEATKSNCS